MIYYTVNGQLRARKKPGSVKNPRTPKQTAQRMRVKGIGALFRSLDFPLRCVWNRLAEAVYPGRPPLCPRHFPSRE